MYSIKWLRVVLTITMALLFFVLANAGGLQSGLLQLPFYGQSQSAHERINNIQVRVYLHNGNKVLQISVEEYLVGVVAAEMPASFDLEALKAQAIAARTYILRRLPAFEPIGTKVIHEQADICDLPEHGQAWIDEQTMKNRWGKRNFTTFRNKIQAAVKSTEGIVLTYQGKLINPMYHASCGGVGTESALTVWGRAIPYLIEVNCSENQTDPKTRHYYTISVQEIDRRLGTDLEVRPAFSLDRQSKPFKIVAQSSRGRIKLMQMGSKEITGTEIRSKLQLASTRFEMKQGNRNMIEIETIGAGHAVGMCQRGAEAMAKVKHNYSSILKHYFPGTSLARVSQK